jgi:glycosyltransferase involved in cell wall biosynthesis
VTKPGLSIIIPALNECPYLAKLLYSIRQQTYIDLEVVVVDSHSKDLTARVAKLFDCTVIQSDGGVSKARNDGAKAAQSDRLLFLDADVIFPDPGWLQRFIDFVNEKNAELAHVYSIPDHKDIASQVFVKLRNFYTWNLMNTLGWFIFCSRDVFDKVGGFNQKARIGEDGQFGKRANEYTGLWIYSGALVVSVRRYKKEGYTTNLGLLYECGKCYERGDYDCSKCEIGKNQDLYKTGEFR